MINDNCACIILGFEGIIAAYLLLAYASIKKIILKHEANVYDQTP